MNDLSCRKSLVNEIGDPVVFLGLRVGLLTLRTKLNGRWIFQYSRFWELLSSPYPFWTLLVLWERLLLLWPPFVTFCKVASFIFCCFLLVMAAVRPSYYTQIILFLCFLYIQSTIFSIDAFFNNLTTGAPQVTLSLIWLPSTLPYLGTLSCLAVDVAGLLGYRCAKKHISLGFFQV